MRKIQELYIFQPHQHVHFSYCGVEVCNALGQSLIQGIAPALHSIHDINQNHMNEDQRFFYSEFDKINPDEVITINILPFLIQATLPSFRLRIFNVDGDVVHDDEIYFIRLADHLLWQGHTYTILMEEARQVIRCITVGVKNSTLRAFVVFVLVISRITCLQWCRN
jgi:hypothetical protein